MRTMYEYQYPIGCKIWENIPDDFPESVPYTSVPPLPDVPLERQFWNPSERKWEEVITQDVSKKLTLLETLYGAMVDESKTIKETAIMNAKQITDTQMAMADVYEMVLGGETK